MKEKIQSFKERCRHPINALSQNHWKWMIIAFAAIFGALVGITVAMF